MKQRRSLCSWVFLWCSQDLNPVCRSGPHLSDRILDRVQEGMTKMIKSMERLPDMGQLNIQGLFSLEER